MAGQMLDYADHAAALQAVENGTAQGRNAHRFAAQGAVPDDIVGIRLADIEQRQAVDGDAHFAQADRNRLGVEACRLDRRCRSDIVKPVKDFPGRESGPDGFLHPRHPAAFLIDQYRQIVAAMDRPQFVGQSPELRLAFDIAAKNDIARRVAFAKKRLLVGGQAQTPDTKNRRCHRHDRYFSRNIIHTCPVSKPGKGESALIHSASTIYCFETSERRGSFRQRP